MSTSLLMSVRCAYSRKYCKIFTVISELVFPDLEVSRRNIFGPAPEIGRKEMILITLVETIIYVFSIHYSI